MEGYLVDRHYRLWEENNKQLKRIVFLTIVMSIALIVKVLIPYVDFSEKKRPVISNIEILNEQKDAAETKLRVFEQTERSLQEINRYIENQPWQTEKQELIERYAALRTSPPPQPIEPDRYQREADTTISNIGRQLQQNIIQPLQASSRTDGTLATGLEELTAEVQGLDQFVGNWVGRYQGVNWYATIDRKESAMRDLTRELNRELDDFSVFVGNQLRVVEQEKEKIEKQTKALDQDINKEQDLLDKIEAELQSILPQWLRGLVSTDQVLQIMPIALLVASAYVFFIGLSLTHHFNLYAEGKALSENVKSDPVMSSLWTLIPRGSVGTALTVLAYTLFFLAIWLLFERSMRLLLNWVTIDSSQAWIGKTQFWNLFLWVGRLVMIGMLVYIGATRWRISRMPHQS